MPLVTTEAIVLSALRYGETSKIVRLATEECGVQSAIAKGALRPRSRFGAALQLLSLGQAQLLMGERRELHTLTAFDVIRIPVGLAGNLDRYATATALAELLVRFAPASRHHETFHLLRDALAILELTPPVAADSMGLRILWQMVAALGFAPSVAVCVRDGSRIPPGPLALVPEEGGALCARCATARQTIMLAAPDRADLEALLAPHAELPVLDERHAAAHRRLLARYIRAHLSEGASLPALAFWHDRPWARAPNPANGPVEQSE